MNETGTSQIRSLLNNIVLLFSTALMFSMFIKFSTQAQTVYNLAEINSDLRITGDANGDSIGNLAVMDFNCNGSNDLFVGGKNANYGKVYGFFDIDFSAKNMRWDLRLLEPDIIIYSSTTWWYSPGSYFATCDSNNDGYDDLVASDYFHCLVWVFFGSSKWTSGTTIDLSTQQADVTIAYDPPNYIYFGELSSGDINFDGIDDIIIGAMGIPNNSGVYTGAAYVIYGSSDLEPYQYIDLSLVPADLTIYGHGGNERLGADTACSDINADGIDDLIVGAPYAEETTDYRGQVYIIYGSTEFPANHVIDLALQQADLTIIGPQALSEFGYAVGSGNINGDASYDIYGSANKYDAEEENDIGAVYIIYGREDFAANAVIDLAIEDADIECYGETSDSWLGIPNRGLENGDIDGDGYHELLISAHLSTEVPNENGVVYLLQGSPDYPPHHVIDFALQQPSIKILGDSPDDELAAGGEITDVDGDGIGDLLLGAWSATRLDRVQCGEVYIILGHAPFNDPPRIVAGPGPDPMNSAEVRLFDPYYNSSSASSFRPYLFSSYGAVVGSGDLDGDGYCEVITGPGPGPYHPPFVAGFDEIGKRKFQFMAYGARRYGVNVVTGEIDGDGSEEIITGAGPGEIYGPHVRGWRWTGGTSASPIAGVNFLAYGTHRWGVNVATGDIDGDGIEEIVTGAGPGSVFGPHVRGWDWDGTGSARPIPGVSYLAYSTHQFGVNVACGDIDGDSIDEIVTGPGPGEMFSSHVRGWNYDGQALAPIGGVNFIAFPSLPLGYGVVVNCGDVDNDRVDEILTVPGPRHDFPPLIKAWNYDGVELTPIQRMTFELFEQDEFFAGARIAFGHFYQYPPFLP